tara:strand:- start:230 stop:424 length:195 start_codon:yes stop_codon:yes gene_type:complete
MNEISELKLHPSFWTLHKKFWNEEINNLDKSIADIIVNNPYSPEARRLNEKVIVRIKKSLLTRA